MANSSEYTPQDPYAQSADSALGTTVIQPQATEPSEADVNEFITLTRRIEDELRAIVVGQERVIRELMLALLAGGHVLLEGVPGLGKTLLVRTLSEVLDISFNRIQFTPDLMPADILGTNIVMEAPGGRREFQFQK